MKDGPFARLAAGLIGLFYPKTCLACGENPLAGTDFTCPLCQVTMPQTGQCLNGRDNDFTQKFTGRLPLVAGAAFFFFSKEGGTRSLLHQLKYRDRPELGLQLGRAFGSMLKNAPGFEGIELVVPVPLHPKKERERGYNQAALFAEGIAETMGVAWAAGAMRRLEYRETQAKKKRRERHENARDLYEAARPGLLAGRHVLLVDDVLTTGATLENCGLALAAVPGARISMATIAMTKKGMG